MRPTHLVAIAFSILVTLTAVQCRAQIDPGVPVLYSIGGFRGEFFGDCIDSLPDLDGDGIRDFIVGAPFGPAGGRAVVFSGRDGTRLFEVTATRAEEQLGWEVAGAGDLDGDGRSELLMASPQGGANGAGTVAIYSGGSRTLIRTLAGERLGDRFGERISSVADLDGDRVREVIVGAPLIDVDGRVDAGRVYVFSGASGERLFTLEATAANDRLGSSVAGLPDMDGDGVPEIGVGAYSAGPGGKGQVYVFSGRTHGKLMTASGESDGSTFGRHYLGSAVDSDGDGVNEVVTADIGHNRFGGNTGRAYVLSGRTGAIVRSFTGTDFEQYFGTGTKQISDVNGDGVPDLFVGAAFDNGGGALAGKLYVYSGRDGTLIRAINGRRSQATFGARGVDLGDIDGDGASELLVAAPTDPSNGSGAGRVYVISGTAFPRTAATVRFGFTSPITLVRGTPFELRVDGLILSCDTTAAPGRGQIRIDVDGQLDHRTCSATTHLRGNHALGSHQVTATLEDGAGQAIAGSQPATATVNLVDPPPRRRTSLR